MLDGEPLWRSEERLKASLSEDWAFQTQSRRARLGLSFHIRKLSSQSSVTVRPGNEDPRGTRCWGAQEERGEGGATLPGRGRSVTESPCVSLPIIWKKTSSRLSMSLTLNTCCSLSFLEAKALMFAESTRGPTPNTYTSEAERGGVRVQALRGESAGSQPGHSPK